MLCLSLFSSMYLAELAILATVGAVVSIFDSTTRPSCEYTFSANFSEDRSSRIAMLSNEAVTNSGNLLRVQQPSSTFCDLV